MQGQFWESYVDANQTFADTVFEIWQPGDMIWVHDYHLMLVPQMLRRKLPNVQIGFFLHTPYPTYEVYRVLPFREQVLEGLLSCDLVGFHCFSYARHFLRSCSEMLGYEVTPDGVNCGGKLVKVGIFPIGIEPSKWTDNLARTAVQNRITEFREQFAGKKVLVGVDRLHPIKGLPHKLVAVETFLDRHPEWQGKVVLIQVGVPSRVEVQQYQKLSSTVNQLVGRINSKFGKVDFNPIHYINRSVDFDELCALYAVADVLVVSSLRDGMNLVCFEYVACQEENQGVLVLSEFAGSAQSFSAAIQLNPWNISEMAEAIHQAVEMTHEERAERHALMSEYVHKYTSSRWGQTFLDELRSCDWNDQDQEESQQLKKLRKGDVFSAYHQSKKRLLFLGYEGTLIRVGSLPQLSKPNKQILKMLHHLCNDPRNTVFLVSGHTRAQMTSWFGDVNIGLIAEHGCFLKWAGEGNEWQQTVPPQDDSLREAVMPILKSYTSSVQGSYVHEKELSLTWEYSMVASEFGDWHANELQNYLTEVLSNVPTDVIMCNRFMELRPYGVSTQSVLSSMFDSELTDESIDPATAAAVTTGTAAAATTTPAATTVPVVAAQPLAAPVPAVAAAKPLPVPQPNLPRAKSPPAHIKRPKVFDDDGQDVPLDDDQPYDFVFSVGDDRADEFIFFTDPEACPTITTRLAEDAAQFYCLVNFREGSTAHYYLEGFEAAIQVVHSLAVASTKRIARQTTAAAARAAVLRKGLRHGVGGLAHGGTDRESGSAAGLSQMMRGRMGGGGGGGIGSGRGIGLGGAGRGQLGPGRLSGRGGVLDGRIGGGLSGVGGLGSTSRNADWLALQTRVVKRGEATASLPDHPMTSPATSDRVSSRAQRPGQAGKMTRSFTSGKNN